MTDLTSHAGVPGATVTAGDATATTAADGSYDMSVPVGAYAVTAAAYGYGSATKNGVVVTDGQTTTADFALTVTPKVTVSGTVTDGSGHGWPLYAKLTVTGTPLAPAFTSPYTGRYSLSVPAGATYALHVDAVYPGYPPVDTTVAVGTSSARKDIAVDVDVAACSAAGYTRNYLGLGPVTFDGTTAPAGWTVTNGAGSTGNWTFDDPGSRGNLTGGAGGFAISDSDNAGIGSTTDSSLVSPSVDLSAQAPPSIGFDTYYDGYFDQVGDVDVSTDGGATWTSVWEQTTSSIAGPQVVDISAQAAEQTGREGPLPFHLLVG